MALTEIPVPDVKQQRFNVSCNRYCVSAPSNGITQYWLNTRRTWFQKIPSVALYMLHHWLLSYRYSRAKVALHTCFVTALRLISMRHVVWLVESFYVRVSTITVTDWQMDPGVQHPVFPGGHPSKYISMSRRLNCMRKIRRRLTSYTMI